MAKECLQCGKKIGFFQTAVEKVYCSEDCAEAARKEMARQQREADSARDEAKRRAAEEAEHKLAEDKAVRAHEQRLRTCPKCSKPWRHTPAAEEGGAQTGSCAACGFTAEFVAIEPCPNCRATSLVVAPTGSARCPRCKHAS
jgi:hypothetical protein